MMSKLYEISYNKRQWNITGSRETKYILLNLSTNKGYVACGDIIGICQVTDDEFLIHRRIQRYKWQILRVQFKDDDSKVLFSKDFEHFYFLTDDTILFDNYLVYSISKNKEVKEFDWLKWKHFELKKINDSTVLLLNARHGNNNDRVTVLVDIETFKPISQVYSSLRDSFFDVQTSEDVVKIINEDARYIDIINWNYYYLDRKRVKEGIDTLISRYQKENDNN